jgi:hypothetical protein
MFGALNDAVAQYLQDGRTGGPPASCRDARKPGRARYSWYLRSGSHCRIVRPD